MHDFEILAVKGNITGVKREVVVFSCYIPPKLNKKVIEKIFESLTDAIGKANANANSPWLIVTGDWNRYHTDILT